MAGALQHPKICAPRSYGFAVLVGHDPRDLVQMLIGQGLADEDFAKLIVLQAEASALELEPENVSVDDGL